MAFPRPEDLADDGYIGRVTVNGVDAFVRQACRRLEERAEAAGREHRPGHRRPRPGGRLADLTHGAAPPAPPRTRADSPVRPPASSARPSPSSPTPASSSAPATTPAARTAPPPATSSRCATWRAAPPWPSCWSWASSRSPTAPPTLLPAEDTDDLELVADAGLPFHPPDRRPAPSAPDPPSPDYSLTTTRVRRHVRAVPGPPLLHRACRCALCRHRA